MTLGRCPLAHAPVEVMNENPVGPTNPESINPQLTPPHPPPPAEEGGAWVVVSEQDVLDVHRRCKHVSDA